jgi:hypothetical protein
METAIIEALRAQQRSVVKLNSEVSRELPWK